MSDQPLNIQAIIATAKKVLISPVEFYRLLATTGGWFSPVVFVAVMALISAVILTILAMVNLGDLAHSFSFMALILMPIFAVVFSFVGAAILFIIWKMMGSTQSFATAYPCVAYSFAVMPIIAVLSIVPYIDGIIQTLWFSYLMYIASTEVHQLKASKAKIVFAVLAAVFILLGMMLESTGRQLNNNAHDVQDILEQAKQGQLNGMDPEQMKEHANKLLERLEEAQRQQQQLLQQ